MVRRNPTPMSWKYSLISNAHSLSVDTTKYSGSLQKSVKVVDMVTDPPIKQRLFSGGEPNSDIPVYFFCKGIL